MSEEKTYGVKNDRGEFLVENVHSGSFEWGVILSTKKLSEQNAEEHGGHVIALVEEPEKMSLTKEQAKIVEGAKNNRYPATFISDHSYDEELLMNALVNGYTVAKEKKYNVKVPHVYGLYYFKKYDSDRLGADMLEDIDDTPVAEFTAAEIEHYGLQDCEKVWCDSDD